MITLEDNVQLSHYNSFGVEAIARRFCQIRTVGELQHLVGSDEYHRGPQMILGEGSNVLFVSDYPGLVIHMAIKGIEMAAVSDNIMLVTACAGESWHGLVMHCVANNLGGIENLSLIPGTCGAAPIQNIGAYGVEIENCVEKVAAVDRLSGEVRTFKKEECRFEYRESIFKHGLREKYFISSITLSLTRKNHLFNIGYGALRDTLIEHGVNVEKDLDLRKISDAVIHIRQKKLPDVKVLGSAGSFFKNPMISNDQFEKLKISYPMIPFYPSVNQNVKIPAGWLIEQCGWKGKRVGNIGVHQHQALVIVNYGGGKGSDIFQLANAIRDSVNEKFNIIIETEVNIIGTVFHV